MQEQVVIIDNADVRAFYGVNDENLNRIREVFPEVKLTARGNQIKLQGEPDKILIISQLIENIVREIQRRGALEHHRFSELLHSKMDVLNASQGISTDPSLILYGVQGNPIRAKTKGQQEMVTLSANNDILFAIGPAGTGKTYTAVALAVKALKDKRVRKIILVRPAVEAGESLGFLPGDLKEKVDPYLRPLYDALEDMILPEKFHAYLEKNIIEIAPLAYMRGRTLTNAFILLDEAQNATEMQMKMFLTRLGLDSKIIVTGDTTQIDLAKNQKSGLLQALRIFQNVPNIGFVFLNAQDVVRHRLVKKILEAYETDSNQFEKK